MKIDDGEQKGRVSERMEGRSRRGFSDVQTCAAW